MEEISLIQRVKLNFIGIVDGNVQNALNHPVFDSKRINCGSSVLSVRFPP